MPRISEIKYKGVKFCFLQGLSKVTRRFRLNRISGMERLIRLFYSPYNRKNDYFEIIVEYNTDLLIKVDTSSYVEWLTYFFGYSEPTIHDLMEIIFKPGFIAFDVGANIGSLTLSMSKLAHVSGKIVAVEPHPQVFKRLLENISLNRINNVIPIQCALSNEEGKLILFSPKEHCNKGLSSLVDDKLLNVDNSYDKISCDVRKLDRVFLELNLKKLDFIKIDTQGNDYYVIEGAKETISTFRPHIIFEWHERLWKNAKCGFHQAEQFFAGMDYSLYVINSGYLSKVDNTLPESADIFAVPN